MTPGVIASAQRKPLTPLQKVSHLILNVPSIERGMLLDSLENPAWCHAEQLMNEVAGACRNALSVEVSQERRRIILSVAEEVADLLERQQEDFEARQSEAQIVATIPEFVYLAHQGALPPVEHASLEMGMARVARVARETLEFSIPYISNAGVDIVMEGVGGRSRRGLRVRILSLLTSPHLDQNLRGVYALAKRFEQVGAEVEIRSPTDEQARTTGAIAVMHAKIVAADRMYAYLGTGNISLAALSRGFEVGVLMKGVLAKNLWNLFDYVYTGHTHWSPPQAPPNCGSQWPRD